MNWHLIRMIIGCIVPLLLIFILPLLGIAGKFSILFFIVVMFACHLLMARGHGDHSDSEPHHRSHLTKEDIK